MAISSSKFTSLASPWEQVRNVSLGAGPVFDLAGGGQRTDAIGNFNKSLIEMLKRHQKLGTAQLQQRSLQYQGEQANEVMAQTPAAETTYAPEQQSAMRSASAQAIQPSIEGTDNRTQTFSEQIQGLASVLSMAQQMSAQMENAELEKAKLAASQSSAASTPLQQWDYKEFGGKVYMTNPYTGEMVETGIAGGEQVQSVDQEIGGYINQGYTRNDIENMYKDEKTGVVNIPESVQSSLDRYFGYVKPAAKRTWNLGPFHWGAQVE